MSKTDPYVVSGNEAGGGDATTPFSDLARRLISHGAWAFAGRLVMSVSSILISILLTRLLTPAEVGAYFLALSVVTAAAVVARGGLEKTVLQVVAQSLGTGDEARARSAVVRVLSIAAGTVALVGLALSLGVGRWLAAEAFSSEALVRIAAFMGLWMAYLAFETLLAETFRGFHDVPRASVYGGAISRTLCVLGFATLWLGWESVSLRVIVVLTLACGFLGSILAAGALKRKLTELRPEDENGVPAGSLLRIAWPLLVSNLTLFLTGHADLWILGIFRSESEVALYAVAVRLVLLVGMSLTIVNAILPPLIGELYARDDRERLERVIRTTASVAALPAVVALGAFILAGGPILGITFGSFYREAGPILALLSVGQLVNVLVGSCGYLLVMSGHQRDLMRTAVVSGAISVIGGLIVVGPFGAVGVAAAVVVGSITQQLLMLWLAWRRVGVWTHASPRYLSTPTRAVLTRFGRS